MKSLQIYISAILLIFTPHFPALADDPGINTDASPPNIFFITIDDLNTWPSPFGKYPKIETPNMARLAELGITFTQAYATSSECNPSRTSLLTGLLPTTTGIYTNINTPWRDALPDQITIPQFFKLWGYHVLGAGKIFHESENDPVSWHEFYYPPASPKPEDGPLNGIVGLGDLDWGIVDEPQSEFRDVRVADYVVSRLEEESVSEPFFMGCGFFQPHLPWYLPQPYAQYFDTSTVLLPLQLPGDLSDVPAKGLAQVDDAHKAILDKNAWKAGVAAYAASIRYVDDQLGRVLNALEASPYRDNTIIVLLSDHGFHLGEKEHWEKGTLWEESTRVPLIIAAPDLRAAGAETDQIVSLLDVFPTLVELAGLPVFPGLEGTSLVSLMDDPEQRWLVPAITTYPQDAHAVRFDFWKYIQYRDGSSELYDLIGDKYEWYNLTNAQTLETVVAYGKSLIPGEPQAPYFSQLFVLQPNYPNPFNGSTTIRFRVLEAGRFRCDLFNLLGEHQQTLVDEHYETGLHEIGLDSGSLATGVYIYRMVDARGNVASHKLMVLR